MLPQKEASISGFMGSQHVYDLSSTSTSGPLKGTTKVIWMFNKNIYYLFLIYNITLLQRKAVGAGVDVALDPSEMANLDEETLRAKFEEAQQVVDKHFNSLIIL